MIDPVQRVQELHHLNKLVRVHASWTIGHAHPLPPEIELYSLQILNHLRNLICLYPGICFESYFPILIPTG